MKKNKDNTVLFAIGACVAIVLIVGVFLILEGRVTGEATRVYRGPQLPPGAMPPGVMQLPGALGGAGGARAQPGMMPQQMPMMPSGPVMDPAKQHEMMMKQMQEMQRLQKIVQQRHQMAQRVVANPRT